MSGTADKPLPRPPREPDPADCCGSGCEPCIFEIYEERLERWRERCRAIREAEAEAGEDQ